MGSSNANTSGSVLADGSEGSGLAAGRNVSGTGKNANNSGSHLIVDPRKSCHVGKVSFLKSKRASANSEVKIPVALQ